MKLIKYFILCTLPLTGMIAKRSHFMILCKKIATGQTLIEEIPQEQFLWVDCDGKTILHYATYSDKNGILIQSLCDACPELLEKTDKAQYTPLHTAAFHGNINAVEALLEKNANPSAKTHSGKTPAHLAMFLTYFPAIKSIIGRLLHAGITISAVDIYGNTPFHIIAYQGKQELYQYVSRHIECNTSLRNNDNYTAEHIFFTAQTPRLAQQYLERAGKLAQLESNKSQKTKDQRDDSKASSNFSLRPS